MSGTVVFQTLCEHFFRIQLQKCKATGNRKNADLPHVASPMSVTFCHPVSFTFHRPNPYHAVVIKLQNKQYYLLLYFLKFSKSVSPKVITDT